MGEGDREAGGRCRCEIGRQLAPCLGDQAAHRFQVRSRVFPARRAALRAEVEAVPGPVGPEHDVQGAVAGQRHRGEEGVADQVPEKGRVGPDRDRGGAALHHGHAPAPGLIAEEELRP